MLTELFRRKPRPWFAGNRPLTVLYACTAAIILVLLVSDAIAISRIREARLATGETNLTSMSMILAEQADRSFQSLDLLLVSVAERIAAEGVVDDATLATRMGGQDVHRLLMEKLSGVPQADAITIINSHGQLLNFSRDWPIPDVNVVDRDYFKALSNDSSLKTFISVPVQNRGTGTWTIFLARRVNGPRGEFLGLVLGAMKLDYFEQFYKSVKLEGDSAISLDRADGVKLARYPSTDAIGNNFPNGAQRVIGSANGVARDTSPIDGTMRIKSAHALANYPLLLLVTRSENNLLGDWFTIARVLAAIGLGCSIGILFGSVAIARWWKQQQSLAEAKAEKADAERARALAEAELLREKEKAAEATSRAKSYFLAVMSHEIRTPMNAVLGLASTLLETDLDVAQQEAVAAIQESGDNLLQILNDILDLSKIEAGRIELETLAFSPAALVNITLGIIGPRAAAKNLSLRATVDDGLPSDLMGDAGRIRQILLNLVSNAVKFTSAGEIVVGVRCLDRDERQATIEWSVEDTGIGIAPERIHTLFTEFVQADNSITRRFGGTGLGLAISKRLLDQMQGEIDVASTPGRGSIFRFRVRLPFAVERPRSLNDNAVAVADQLNRHIKALGRPLHVVIAEDNPTNQYVAVTMLKDFDIDTSVVGDGAAAVETVTRSPVDLVFMDVRMPDMDGLEATRAIRARGGAFATLPIVGFTANAFADDIAACLDAGMQSVISKPVRKAAFVAAILAALAA
jgi:signal transduction histidine kinase/ActR/RegA family two-component response regulator